MSLSIKGVSLPVGSKSADVEETTLNDYPKFKVGIVLFAVFELLRKVFIREKQLDGYIFTRRFVFLLSKYQLIRT